MLIDPATVFTASFGGIPKPFTAFATLLEMAVYFVLCLNVGRARSRYRVAAPATDGPEAFQRILRVQINTTEQLVFHLPLLWLAAFAMADAFAAPLGAVWALSRILYARGYYKKPQRRTKGFVIGMVVNLILFSGALAGTLAAF